MRSSTGCGILTVYATEYSVYRVWNIHSAGCEILIVQDAEYP